MPDPLRKVQTGQPLAIPAEAYNAFVDAAQDFQSRRRSQAQDPRFGFRQTGIVRLKNGSGVDQPRFAILGIDQPIIPPDDNLDAFRNEVTLVGVVPDAEEHTGRYAILLEPVGAGRIGLAVVAGVSIVKLDVKEECHGFAEIIESQASHLRSGGKGSAIILWKASGTGVQWAVVRIGVTDHSKNCEPATCPEAEGSCAFEARFVEGSTTETEWVQVESGCAKDHSCHKPSTPPTIAQAEANEWTRTCCTPTMRDQDCGASCTWVWEGEAWVLDDNPCPSDCPCESPSPGLTGTSGSNTRTPCGQVPSGSGPCATTTTAPEECPDANCAGECHWVFRITGATRHWVKVASDCESNCCVCVAPQGEGEPCEEAVTGCKKQYGPDRGNCAGECRAYYHFDAGIWVAEECGGGCLCEHPEPDPPADGPCNSPMIKGRCVPNPCQGGCDWAWDGSGWILQTSDCDGECQCGPPLADGTEDELARTCCTPPPPTTTTSTTTSTTTTPTTTPNCCEIFGRDPYITVCSDSNKVVLQPQEAGAWTGVTLLPCGDQFGARVECTPSETSDCTGFRLQFNMPCANPPIFTGTITDCNCAAYQDSDIPDPPYLFLWEATEPVDVSGCGCCGGMDPSTTTPPL